jgi:ABC-type Fe3+/spermidine/putrescine transport system ATPase subunit
VGAPVSLSAKLQKRFSGSAPFALDVELMARPGITVLFGPSGSGKTTILECIAGLIKPDAGWVKLGDEDITRLRPRDRGIGYLFQEPALFPHMTARENVEYGVRSSSRSERRTRAMKILERMRVSQLADRRPDAISGGEKQRVALARTLATEPHALLLDEPLSALDVATAQSIIADLRAWNAESPIPIIYVTHALEETFALADRVIVLDGGTVVRQGSAQDVLATERESLLQMLW